MKLLFLCGHKSPYGLSHLKPLLNSKFDIVAVVIATDDRWRLFHDSLGGKSYYKPKVVHSPLGPANAFIKKIISSNIRHLFKYDIKKAQPINDILREHNIPLLQIFDVNEKTVIEKIKEINPDLILSAAFPQILSKDLITIPHKGSVNFHPSLLPKYRGAHPHFWAIAKGEKVGGLTAHFMTENIDDGDIIAQVKYPIEQYIYSQHYKKIIEEVPTIVRMVEEFFYQNTKKPVPQDLSEVSYFKNDREIHKRIFWNTHSAEEIKNLIRTERAFCFFRGVKVKFMKAYVTKSNRNLTNNVLVEPGTIVDVYKDCIVVKTTDACINIEEFEDRGRNMSFNKWVIKHNIYIGEKFD
ncbi:MAG: hypothetical protein A2W23_07375 [Planctomycetes bacterium RBG_16_43_13]|nr:MAG: hypothetical protein A2W23_07375 [Planctomycetes bacterium RBG_16_43_13]